MEEDFRQKQWSIAGGIPFDSNYFLRIKQDCKLKKTDLFDAEFGTYYLELGSGWGEVAIELARENPSTGFILMEKKFDRMRKTIRNLEKKGLNNVRILSVNFNWFLEDIFEKEIFDEILLNFPDPWPKKRHHKHRTVNSRFLESILYLLTPQGRFRFATDYGPYARRVIHLFRNDKRFEPIGGEYELHRSNFPISHFERVKQASGSRIYYLLRKKAESSAI
ncbi:tRNA (guanine-N7)-methyltransferase [Leptospira perolatii]|uniref:tRNA (guanine-N(7)-)-methyltransferase n=1 Tax=Leptospira perolatii TaxID=2023191 RepID=A0A2M9ZRD9_9LEPT|nr:methyltransferase domain-containing protein [Leptospira perolatii]PJZ71114.1 tRNA (guanine-N7)-methyltransferase [Leptospira perolatii]PJZ74646.1 tRNA (guanine-N7)-methyltransferase [Leptospira perolatii]